MINDMLYGVLPYVFVTVAVVGAIWRFRSSRYSWSSQSSQFVENKTLFFGSFPWHYGIITLLLGHIVGLIVPRLFLWWNSVPARLYILEIVALSLGFLALFGLLALTYRRLTNSRVKALTTSWDVLLIIVLIIQVVTGLGNALMYKWGSSWYAASAVPWMWSLFKLNPDVTYIANLPLVTKVHIFNALIFIGLIPFTRLAHFVVLNPYKYLARPYQVVRWYKRGGPTVNVIQPE
ncbi:MAG: respiratory nitrate reductase subunit gamma [Thermodesulfobacteriota bacterium]